jgi:hypothetical protein
MSRTLVAMATNVTELRVLCEVRDLGEESGFYNLNRTTSL